MIDFTSSLYLGLSHSSEALGDWEALTLGRPAVLEDPPGAVTVASALARLQGLQAATLLPSTLHLFWDLLHVLKQPGRAVVVLDDGAYPILRWAAEAVYGHSVRSFAHHDAQALAELAARCARGGWHPIIVADGYCPGCNRPAPLRAYAEIGHAHGSWLVLDDTQAIGVLGANPTSDRPYGKGGGGSLRWQGIKGSHVVVGASLAKGFGAPLAVLAGPQTLLRRFSLESRTRLHCSPPSVAVIAAARRALHCTAVWGDAPSRRLAALADRLRQRLSRAGLTAIGELPFPVQSFLARSGGEALRLHRHLLNGGVRALLTSGCGGAAPRLTFIINARHCERDIDCAVEVLADYARAA
jgi:8-amino-7-oxononanoate synthase